MPTTTSRCFSIETSCLLLYCVPLFTEDWLTESPKWYSYAHVHVHIGWVVIIIRIQKYSFCFWSKEKKRNGVYHKMAMEYMNWTFFNPYLWAYDIIFNDFSQLHLVLLFEMCVRARVRRNWEKFEYIIDFYGWPFKVVCPLPIVHACIYLNGLGVCVCGCNVYGQMGFLFASTNSRPDLNENNEQSLSLLCRPIQLESLSYSNKDSCGSCFVFSYLERNISLTQKWHQTDVNFCFFFILLLPLCVPMSHWNMDINRLYYSAVLLHTSSDCPFVPVNISFTHSNIM